MPPLARIMDANANRAREGLRVMEDIARFALNDEPLSRELKTLRHELRAALDQLPPGWIEANRDTLADVGTDISTDSEAARSDLVEVAAAAAKRVTEALRVLEESSKAVKEILPGRRESAASHETAQPLARTFESLRYRAYTIEAELMLRLGTGRARQWCVCVLVTDSLCACPWGDVLTAAIEGGADCIQLREKEMEGGELADRARHAIDLARPAGVSVIINDRIDIAIAADADGVHLGTGDLSIRDAKRIVGRSLLIGASTHHLDEAEQAVSAGADYCGVGAMFASSLKPDRRPAGPEYLRAFVDRYAHKPHLAIGGITPNNIDQLVQAGVRGVAVSSCVCAADNPADVVRSLRAALPQHSAEQARI